MTFQLEFIAVGVAESTAVAALLDELALPNDPTILAQIVADPNTSADILFQLAGWFPEQFCANPIFPLLPLEYPDLVKRMPAAALGGLLRYAGVPGDFLAYLVAYGAAEVSEAARLHINYNDARNSHAQEPREQSLCATIRHYQEALEAPELLYELFALDALPGWLRECLTEPAIVENGGVQPPAPLPLTTISLQVMATDEDPQVRIAVARNPATPPELLAWMQQNEDMGDSNPGVYQALAANPNTPAAVLEQLAANQTWANVGTRRAVAHNPHASAQALDQLASDLIDDIRHAVAAHPNHSAATHTRMLDRALAACLEAGAGLYRVIALAHPQTDPAILATAVHSPVWLERYALARNPATPESIRALLAQDGNVLVRLGIRI